MINLTIDGKNISVPKGSTILEAARQLKIDIPTLCHLDLHNVGIVNRAASCRVCLVEVKGWRRLAPSCATPVSEGMVVQTNTLRVINARRTVLELLLSDHPKDCLNCAKSGECSLQDLAERLSIRSNRYDAGKKSLFVKDLSPAIERDITKCVMCRRCETMCNEVQTVGVLSGINRGFNSVVAPAFEMPLEDSVCTFCGQCVSVCPTGALVERDFDWNVIEALADPDKVVIVQTAPAVRVALGEMFGLEPGTSVTGKMISALRQMGFDYVFDTDFAADLTIMEEASELLDRLKRHLAGDPSARLPILTSCCPAWVKFIEHQFPDFIDVPSTAKSPQQMFGAVAKTYWAEKLGIPREKMVVVSLMPCLAKKYECTRPEFSVEGNPDVDLSITTREFYRLIKQMNIDFLELPDGEFDIPLGESTGAGVIFGTTGGVIEAATRTAVEWLTDKPLENVEFSELRGLEGCRETTLKVGDLELHIGIAYELGNARKLLNAIRSNEVEPFHAIEIMACPGGCIGGGGQPYHHGDPTILKKRQEAIYREDRGKQRRKSHENPYVQKLYEEFLGKPLGEKAHQLLHTHYFKRHTV